MTLINYNFTTVCRVDGVTELRREIMGVYKNPKVNLKLGGTRFEEEEGVGSGPVREYFEESIRVVDEEISSSSGKPIIFLRVRVTTASQYKIIH